MERERELEGEGDGKREREGEGEGWKEGEREQEGEREREGEGEGEREGRKEGESRKESEHLEVLLRQPLVCLGAAYHGRHVPLHQATDHFLLETHHVTMETATSCQPAHALLTNRERGKERVIQGGRERDREHGLILFV